MIGETGGSVSRMEALSVYRSCLEIQVNQNSDDTRLIDELRLIKLLQEETIRIKNNPRDHTVVVLKSRVVKYGSVGRVVYADHNRNHCRIEFGNGERVSCALSSVEVIDWTPLPPVIPMVGERVVDLQTGQDVVVVEWKTNVVRVQPPGLSEDMYTLDRKYVSRKDSVVQM